MNRIRKAVTATVIGVSSIVSQFSAAVAPEDYMRDDTNPNRDVITSLNVSLKNSSINPNKDLIVRGDTVTITDPLRLNGHAIQIFARKIHFNAGADIITAGPKAEFDYKPANPAPAGRNPGEPGVNGSDAYHGQSSEGIVLIGEQITADSKPELISRGGNGGRGQTGGAGSTGTGGKPGAQNTSDRRYANGGRGGPGGRGGTPGRGGNGGNAGHIYIGYTGNGLQRNNFRFNATGGTPGENGQPGPGGPRGPGGPAGSYIEFEPRAQRTLKGFEPQIVFAQIREREPLHRTIRRVRIGITGPAGAPGQDGPPTDYKAEPGRNGNINLEQRANSADQLFAQQLTPLLGGIVLRQVVLDNLNGDIEIATERLLWLKQLLELKINRSANSSTLVGVSGPDWNVIPDQHFENLREQVSIQLRRLQAGLDAYGNPSSFVPMLRFDSYASYIRNVIDTAEKAEVVYERYYNEAESAAEASRAVEEALKNLDSLIVNLEEEITQAEKRQVALDSDIQTLLAPVQTAKAILLQRAQTFQVSVDNEVNGVKIKDIVNVIGAVVGIGKGVGPAMSSVSSLFAAIDADSEKFTDYLDTVMKNYKVAQGKFDDITSKYKELEGILEEQDIPDVLNDSTRIFVDREEFLASVNSFAQFAPEEATDVRKGLDVYTNLALTRNTKIAEHDAITIQLGEKRNQIRQAKADQADLTERAANQAKPYLPELRDFMERNLDAHKAELVRAIHYASRALSYREPQSTGSRPNFNRQTVQALRSTAANLQRELISSQEGRGQAFRTVKPENTATMSLKRLIGDDGLKRLIDGEDVPFIISSDNHPFPAYFHVFATGLAAVNLVGLDRPEEYGVPAQIKFTHRGQALLRDGEGDIKEFIHQARSTIAYDEDEGINPLGQDNIFIPLSVAGAWHVSVGFSGNANEDYDFDRLEDVTFKFEAQGLTPN